MVNGRNATDVREADEEDEEHVQPPLSGKEGDNATRSRQKAE